MIFIYPASTPDIPLIRELTYKVWPQTYTPILAKEQIDYMLDMMYSPAALEQQMNNKHYFIIARDENDMPVGFASYSEMKKEIFKLHKLYVLPQKQGSGVGRELLEFITNDIKFMGAKALDLNVNRHNHNAKAFYEKNSFVVIAEEDIDIGGGYFMNDYILRLYLD
jgi:ribosomal protein S18 acetylase RimI-like enzyme